MQIALDTELVGVRLPRADPILGQFQIDRFAAKILRIPENSTVGPTSSAHGAVRARGAMLSSLTDSGISGFNLDGNFRRSGSVVAIARLWQGQQLRRGLDTWIRCKNIARAPGRVSAKVRT